MPIDALFLRKAVGYAMWQLTHPPEGRAAGGALYGVIEGEPAVSATYYQELLTRMRQHKDYGHITDARLRSVIEEAVSNVVAREIADAGPKTRTLGESFVRPASSGERVGVRVVLTGTDPHGNIVTKSITMNLRSTSTIEDAKSLAIDAAERDSAEGLDHDSPGLTGFSAEIVALFAGGLEGSRIVES